MRPLLALFLIVNASAAELSVTAYPSIQAALDAYPNRMLFVPAGDYPITEKIRLRGARSGLFGPGRIVQQNQEPPIIEIENAQGVEIRDLTLTRPEGKMETGKEGVIAQKCSDLVIENVRVIDNHSKSGSILVTDSHRLASDTVAEIRRQLPRLGRQQVLSASVAALRVILVDGLDTGIEVANRYAPTLLHEMVRRDAKKGLATLCIGGGQGVALAVERS